MEKLTRRGLFGLAVGAAALPVVGKPAAEVWSDGLPEGSILCAGGRGVCAVNEEYWLDHGLMWRLDCRLVRLDAELDV